MVLVGRDHCLVTAGLCIVGCGRQVIVFGY